MLEDGIGVARESSLRLPQRARCSGAARRLVNVALRDTSVPALELVELRLLLVELRQRELLLLDLLVDLDEELRALGSELAVLVLTSLVPRLYDARVVSVGKRLCAKDGQLAADPREDLAQARNVVDERFGVRHGDDRLLQVVRTGTAQLAPDRDAGARVVRRQAVDHEDPIHRGECNARYTALLDRSQVFVRYLNARRANVARR